MLELDLNVVSCRRLQQQLRQSRSGRQSSHCRAEGSPRGSLRVEDLSWRVGAVEVAPKLITRDWADAVVHLLPSRWARTCCYCSPANRRGGRCPRLARRAGSSQDAIDTRLLRCVELAAQKLLVDGGAYPPNAPTRLANRWTILGVGTLQGMELVQGFVDPMLPVVMGVTRRPW